MAAACGRRRRPASRSTIVGVLKDVKQGGVDKEAGTELYFNFEQLTAVATGYGIGTMNIVIRTTQPADALSGTIRSAVAGLDPSLPIVKLRSVEDVFAEAIGRPRLLAQLLGIFGGLAILLAAIAATACFPTWLLNVAARSASAWRWAPIASPCWGWCWRRGSA